MRYTKIEVLFHKKPPYFIGSQIRGAFGYALKSVVCINPSYKCEECFAKDNCIYFDFYEKRNSFHKYRLDFKLGEEFYDFGIYLFEKSCEKLPYILSSLQVMLTKNGLGKDRERVEEFSMFINGVDSYKDKRITIPNEYIKEFRVDDFYPNIKLELITPLRLKKDNRFIKVDNLTIDDLINSIYQRQMKLLDKEYKKFPYPIKGEITKRELNFKELTRYSNRQKTKMMLGGIMGHIEIAGLNQESYRVLKLGELIGVGKQTVFGLGKIEVKEIG